MNLVRIVKLFRKNLVLLLLVPMILAVLVKQLTKDEILKYESETTLYTGLASGSSVETKNFSLFETNNAFDNLLNLIKSREVASETSIRLLVQHLSLTHPDPTILLDDNYKWVHKFVPSYVKKMVIQSIDSTHLNSRSQPTDTVYLANGDIVFKNKLYHFVKKSETLFTLARNYGVSINSIMNHNTLESEELMEGLPIVIKDGNDSLGIALFDSTQLQIESSSVINSPYEKSVRNLITYLNSSDTNFLYGLLNSKNPYYSLGAISSVVARRVQSSDLVSIKYSSFDPAICMHTLNFMTKVVIGKFKDIKENQSDAVVKYFLNEVKKTADRLQNAEDRLLEFNKKNNIINYQEQSRAVAIVKEDLNRNFTEVKLKFEAAAAVLKRLEQKMGMQQAIQLKTSRILELRNQLAEVQTRITLTESFEDPDPKNRAKLQELKSEADKTKKLLTQEVEQLYNNNVALDGVPIDDVFTAWLDNVIKYEEARAGVKVMTNFERDYYEYYKTFAPLGATQKRLEREINVVEQEYLSLLHSLNLSKLKQQDVELSSDIKALDPPYFPLKPIPGKAGLMVVVAGVMGFVLVVFLILALEFLNNNIRTAERLEEFSRLKQAGVLPRIMLEYSNFNLDFIIARLSDQITQEARLAAKYTNGNFIKPKVIVLASTMEKEGKTIVGTLLASKLRAYGEKVAFLMPENTNRDNILSAGYFDKRRKFFKFGEKIFHLLRGTVISKIEISSIDPHDDDFYYEQDPRFVEASNAEQLKIIEKNPYFNGYNYIIIEIPALVYNPYPSELVKSSDISLWIVRANRVWKNADNLCLNTFTKSVNQKPLSVLNGVEIEFVENNLGELPKRRSILRTQIKKIISLRMHERKSL